MDRHFGSRLFGKLNSLGVTHLKAVGRSITTQGGTRESKEMSLTTEQLQVGYIATGLISEREYSEFKSLFDDASFSWRFNLMTSTCGQKPE